MSQTASWENYISRPVASRFFTGHQNKPRVSPSVIYPGEKWGAGQFLRKPDLNHWLSLLLNNIKHANFEPKNVHVWSSSDGKSSISRGQGPLIGMAPKSLS
jgi:hypothetical protein